MTVPHRSVAKALEQLAGDMLIADDGPFVAFVVGVNADGAPAAWACTRDGRAVPFDRLTFGERDDDRGPAPDTDRDVEVRDAPWRFTDLARATTWLYDLCAAVAATTNGGVSAPSWAAGLADAERAWHDRRAAELDHALRVDAHRLAAPWQCRECGRRFTTDIALVDHAAGRCVGRVRHVPAGLMFRSLLDAFALSQQCRCGQIVRAANEAELRAEMAAHVTASEVIDP